MVSMCDLHVDMSVCLSVCVWSVLSTDIARIDYWYINTGLINVTDAGLTAFGDALRSSSTITRVSIISTSTCLTLVDTSRPLYSLIDMLVCLIDIGLLHPCWLLTHRNIVLDRITDVGLKAFGDALGSTPTITSVWLRCKSTCLSDLFDRCMCLVCVGHGWQMHVDG